MNLLTCAYGWLAKPKHIGALFCMAWLAMPVQGAIVTEIEVNDIFPDLSDVTNNADFSQAMVPQNGDTYIAGIGTFPLTSIEDFTPNDLDFWTFDLHKDVPFNVSFDDSDPPQTPGNFSPAAILYMEIEGALFPVAGNGIGSSRSKTVGFNPWQSGRYYFGFGEGNNAPENFNSNDISNPAFFTREFPLNSGETLFGPPVDHFHGDGNTAIYYELTFIGGVFAPTAVSPSAVPVPAALWLFISGLLSLGWMSRHRAGVRCN